MKRRFFLLTLLLYFTSSISSQTLHAILFVNEKEPERQIDRTADMRNMYKFWRKIANCIGYEYVPYQCSPLTFKAENINQTIDALPVKSNDIVIFYYSGHGYNDESDIWPSLSLSDCFYREIDIMKRLKKVATEAKLVMCIADCCNKQARSAYDFTNSYDAIEENSSLNELFTGFKGKKSIIISASIQGQYSWSDLRYGAFYGNAFRQVLSSLSMNHPTWDVVLKNVSDRTYKHSNQKQMPQFNITQSGDPFE